MIVSVSIGAAILSLVLMAISPEDSTSAMIFALLFAAIFFIGIPTACAWVLESKNRSLWWLLLLFGFGIIGIIVVVMLEDRSTKVDCPLCDKCEVQMDERYK